MLNNFLLLFFIIVVTLSYFKINRAIELTILYKLLVPNNVLLVINNSSINMGYWLVYILFFVFIFKLIISKEKRKEKKFDFNLFKPVLIYIGLTLAFMLFASEMKVGVQFKAIIGDAVANFSLAFIIWHTYVHKRDVKIFVRTLIAAFVIMGIYGIYCFITNTNLYVLLCNLLFPPVNDALAIYQEQDRGGLMGRVQSTTSHPMTYAAYLVMVFFLILLLIRNAKRFSLLLYSALIGLVLINMLATGTRSALLAVFTGVLFIVKNISLRTKLLLVGFVLVLLLLGMDTSIFGEYKSYADSFNIFASKDQSAVSGSSLAQRTEQLTGAFDLIKNESVFFGKGYFWCRDYLSNFGDHPVLLAFESTFFVVLIENGLFGVIIWIVLFIGLFLSRKKLLSNFDKEYDYQWRIINAFIFAFITYIILTGLSGAYYFFFILYVIMIKYNLIFGHEPHLITDDELCE